MKTMNELSSEELRDIYCAPENTDDLESIDFDDEPEEMESAETKSVETRREEQ